jgi:hypothetical protein
VIGNTLGSFLNTNMSFKTSEELSMAIILVMLNVRKGLEKYLELVLGNSSYMQILDYEGVPFKCRRCHHYGNMAKDFTLPFKRCS